MNDMPQSFRFAKASVLLVSVFFAVTRQTAQAELAIGDSAPKLQVGKWIQGELVKEFDTNHVYIVEFWATWCGPCRASIPHLNELWQKFKNKGVVVIGQDVWDNDSNVAPFVKKMGDKMTYRVTLDDKSHEPEGFMAAQWWKLGVNHHGIPTVFVINHEGRIAWIGHPMALNEKLLDDILSPHYELAKAAAEYGKQQPEDQKLAAGEDKLLSAVKQKKWDDAESALDDLLKTFPQLQTGFAWIRLKIFLGQKKYDEAYKFADSFSDSYPADVSRQNILAWEIVTQDGVEQRNLALSLKLAERANKAASGKNAAVLDTLARIQFMSEKKTEAIATEQKAVEAASDEEKDNYQKFLTDYQQGRLPKVKE